MIDPSLNNTELHLHLYGCLSPDDVWELGKNHYKSQMPRLQWYEDEFHKAIGRTPNWKDYWGADEEKGRGLLKEDYLFTQPANFSVFQAKFNLGIALAPLQSPHFDVLDIVFRNFTYSPLKYAEYRLLFPHFFSPGDLNIFLTRYAKKLDELIGTLENGREFKIAWSITRDQSYFLQSSLKLWEWRLAHPHWAHHFPSLDLCGDEEDDEPELKKEDIHFLQKTFQQSTEVQPLKILYHVGEVFHRSSVFTALRRIDRVAHFFVDRLGHASALGMNPESLLGRPIPKENPAWTEMTRTWMTELMDQASRRLEASLQACAQSLFSENAPTTYNKEHCELLDFCQKAVLEKFAQLPPHRRPFIETCPTSNHLIGPFLWEHIPTLRLLEAQKLGSIRCAVSSDDPGIMNTSLANEWKIIESIRNSRFG